MAGSGKAGFARMFAEHRATLRGFFTRRGGGEDADDLVQEAYLRLLRAWQGRGEAIAAPEAYLYTVALNLAREQAVKRRASPLGQEELERLATVLGSDACAEQEAERAQRRRRILALLAGLPERTRTVLVMQYRDGLSYRQIGERLGISTHAVKKHVVRGLSECRRAMADEEDAW
ncbi:RNA polymerase sigma factor [Coralloluteibacterium thermophilus]|uniref:RNA polymerase sigma factor n=1 Tax=Coralloluteibacterium thermophilum TaxID=2707049 RepID=A0ABV9NGK8_9GAMM